MHENYESGEILEGVRSERLGLSMGVHDLSLDSISVSIMYGRGPNLFLVWIILGRT